MTQIRGTARLRRKESLASWASRIGTYLTALWLIGRDAALAALAAPEHDIGALELDVHAAVELGKARARASAESRQRRKETHEQ